MAHGACTLCGCAVEECIRDQVCPGEIGRFMKPTTPPKVTDSRLIPGDWVRVKRGHQLAGAAGTVKHVNRSVRPALVTMRQLNGNELRLPLGLVEFVSYAGAEPDVL